MLLIYLCLFVLLGISIFVFLHSFITLNDNLWTIYARVYFVLAITYTWYIFGLLFLSDIRKTKYPSYDNETIAVVVPCYNERPELLKKSLESIIAAKGNKKILLVDDGSKKDIREGIEKVVRDLQKTYSQIEIHLFENNKGKRHALHHAVSKMVQDSEFVITVDSDTVLDENALVRLVEPLKDPRVGASTGYILLLNENQNWLTRLIKIHYWISLNVYKKAQSSVGMVECCSGCLSAYKASIIKEIIDEFLNQEFLGEQCNSSDDRHLTNLILKRKYEVAYVAEAIAYTETPATVRSFLRQQLRWKRGFIREAIYALTYAWGSRKQLFFEMLLWDLTLLFFTFGLRVAILFVIFTQPLFFLIFILPSWFLFMFVHYIFVYLEGKEKVWRLFVYSILRELFLYWLNIYALFTARDKRWVTRG